MTDDDFSLDSLFGDLPREQRLGFYTDSTLDLGAEYDEVVATLTALAGADELYIDDDGYTWQILSSTVDEERRRVAWVEWREKERGHISDDTYHLKARDEHGTLLAWEIETYNPYFGCRVRFLRWIEDAVVLVYEDKHDTFVACLTVDGARRQEIAGEWRVEGHVLTHHPPDEGEVRLKLPSLERL